MLALRLLYTTILIGMTAVILWASGQQALFAIPRSVATNPWFLATLADAYLAFVTAWLIIAYKEQSLPARLLWFVAVMLWGNIAISLYAQRELIRHPKEAPLGELLTRRHPGHCLFPTTLNLLALAAYLLGALHLLK
jgi:hypothetical protein